MSEVQKKIAIVHDWLFTLGGAERVLIQLHAMFPEAPIYTLFARPEFTRAYLPRATIIPSALQKMPFIGRMYRMYAPLMPLQIEAFDLSHADVVISSSVAFAKGLILRPKTRHICYCYSPARMLWDRSAAYERGGKITRHLLRLWDSEGSERVDEFVAISQHVQKRIKKYYRKNSKIIYPPACAGRRASLLNLPASDTSEIEPYYLIVSRLFPHKNLDMAIDAFNKIGDRLIIVGDGPMGASLKISAEKNIQFLGKQDDAALAGYYARCSALIMPNEEDFGLTAIEAMQFGKPVLALRRGGALETVREGVTGEFFDDAIPESIVDGLKRLKMNYRAYDPEIIKKHAEKFSLQAFQDQIMALVR